MQDKKNQTNKNNNKNLPTHNYQWYFLLDLGNIRKKTQKKPRSKKKLKLFSYIWLEN